MSRVSDNFQIVHSTGNAVKDLEADREELKKQIAQLKNQIWLNDHEAHLKDSQNRLRELDTKIEQAKHDAEAERLRVLEHIRAVWPGGHLIVNYYKDDRGDQWIICSKHQNTPISAKFWDLHVGDYDTHPEIKENDPERKARLRRKEQQEREKRELEAEQTFTKNLNRHRNFLIASGAPADVVADAVKRRQE